jgi:hypothetical protein
MKRRRFLLIEKYLMTDLMSVFIHTCVIRAKRSLIVGSLSGSRLKSVRFLVGESSVPVASSVPVQTIKINH